MSRTSQCGSSVTLPQKELFNFNLQSSPRQTSLARRSNERDVSGEPLQTVKDLGLDASAHDHRNLNHDFDFSGALPLSGENSPRVADSLLHVGADVPVESSGTKGSDLQQVAHIPQSQVVDDQSLQLPLLSDLSLSSTPINHAGTTSSSLPQQCLSTDVTPRALPFVVDTNSADGSLPPLLSTSTARLSSNFALLQEFDDSMSRIVEVNKSSSSANLETPTSDHHPMRLGGEISKPLAGQTSSSSNSDDLKVNI